MPPFLRWLIFLALVGSLGFWFLTRPEPLAADALDGLTGDAAAGERVFLAAGCASCHVAPDAEKSDGPPVLAGGEAFTTDFGTFYAPNISPDLEHGVGSWSDLELASAIQRGVGPGGEHLYPVFPYDSYIRAQTGDIVNLIAYLRTLPASETPSRPHDVSFPFNIRRLMGGWKLLYLDRDWVVTGDLTEEQQRGRYLVEALGHCGACHTPRNLLGGPKAGAWLAGGPDPNGKGKIPNITPGGLDWSEDEIVEYLTSGFTPEYDTVGGAMVAVVDKISKLPGSDRAAIAAYLKAVPPHP
ncbi:c-type cytochrome [Oceaniglobus roseus]|uniref:c-type cytochrome n=1 Tax=Oceaniglobus roseus TaxID=1737570 RepID=UPI000C7F12FC|nr:c-type cytochrome [Kandeliimicrobium roseum]